MFSIFKKRSPKVVQEGTLHSLPLSPSQSGSTQSPGWRLTVVVDPALDPRRPELGVARSLFDVYVNPDAPLDTLYDAIGGQLHLADGFVFGCYKVSIPTPAYYQAKEYSTRYNVPVHLISHFASYNLLDESQRRATFSLSTPIHEGGFDFSPIQTVSESSDRRLIRDWFPEAWESRPDLISVLVRIGPSNPQLDSSGPLTLLAYFGKPPTLGGRSSSDGSTAARSTHGSPSFASLHFPRCQAARPPVALEVPRDATIDELKERVLAADGHTLDRASGALNKVVLWRVDMSWREMQDCEQYGGLSSGEMPWPYPPNSPPPVSMSESSALVSSIFPNYLNNTNLVSIFAWVHPTATIACRQESSPMPPHFQYPMIFPTLVESSTTNTSTAFNSPVGIEPGCETAPLPSIPSFEGPPALLGDFRRFRRNKGDNKTGRLPLGDSFQSSPNTETSGEHSLP